MSTLKLTSAQTVGPFFSPCLLRDGACRNVLTRSETVGERIRIEGCIFDGDGLPISDAMIEIWQANASGRYHHVAEQSLGSLDPSFLGFGRGGTNDEGYYWFETIKPGAVPFDDTRLQAPHICVTVFARGLLNHLVTRLYFADEPTNSEDQVLLCVPEGRRETLLAKVVPDSKPVIYRYDIVLQGPGETVFFNI